MKEFCPEIIGQYRNGVLSAPKMRALSKRLIEKIRERRVVIYGAGAAGKQIASALADAGAAAEAFVDKKAAQIGEAAHLRVYPPEELKRFRCEELLVIIAVDPQIFKNSTAEIEGNIAAFCGDDCKQISYGRDLLYILRYAACQARLEKGEAVRLIDCLDCGAESRGCELFLNALKRDTMKEERSELKQAFIPYFGYIVGQRCTLRCRDCCEMVPYYTNGEQVPAQEILDDCRRLATAIQFTMYIELVGGEPFLHPQLPEILEGLLTIENVGYVKVFTNGTVYPSERLLQVLRNPRIVLMWSNYTHAIKGNLLKNVNQTREALEKAGVRYIFSHAETWLDFSTDFSLSDKSEEKLQRDFDDCHIADCLRLYRGTLYRCPHHYAGVQTGHLERLPDECLTLSEYETPKKLSEKLYAFHSLPYIDACRHCRLPYDAAEVPAAVQINAKAQAE